MIDYEKLTYVIMEFEKCHDGLSARLRFGKATGVIQSEFQGLRTAEADGVHLSPRPEKIGFIQFSEVGKKGVNSPSSAFCSVQTLKRLVSATHIREVSLFFEFTDSHVNLILKYLHRHPQN